VIRSECTGRCRCIGIEIHRRLPLDAIHGIRGESRDGRVLRIMPQHRPGNGDALRQRVSRDHVECKADIKINLKYPPKIIN